MQTRKLQIQLFNCSSHHYLKYGFLKRNVHENVAGEVTINSVLLVNDGSEKRAGLIGISRPPPGAFSACAGGVLAVCCGPTPDCRC